MTSTPTPETTPAPTTPETTPAPTTPGHSLDAGPAGPAAHDVVVIGGGAAGLSGAIALARSRRTVLVLDAGEPRNAPAEGVHNLLGLEGVAPAELLERGRAEARSYGVEVRPARVVDVRRASPQDAAPAFVVETDDGGTVRARRVLVATGLVDELPPVAGLAEHWGTRVLHCPYCHGWEVRGRRIAVLGTGPMAGHQAMLFSQLSDDVVLVLAAGVELPPADVDLLGARAVRVVRDAPVAVEAAPDAPDAPLDLRLASGAVLEVDALVVAPVFRARVDFLAGVGLTAEDVETGGHVLGSAVPADATTGATAVPGVVVAGNVTDLTAQVGASGAAGVRAGAWLNADLVREDARATVEALRTAFFERPAWEERYGAAAATWSGQVNAVLADEAPSLTPGRALDVGSGEGADAIWLAERGWRVTGLDFSTAARSRAAARAAETGVAERTEWREADLRDWNPGGERWDLVTSHFFHQPDGAMPEVVRRLAEAVAPGGTLLVVGHHPDDEAHVQRGPRDWRFTATGLLPALVAGEWDVEVVEARSRAVTTPDGATVAMTDAVLRARRR